MGWQTGAHTAASQAARRLVLVAQHLCVWCEKECSRKPIAQRWDPKANRVVPVFGDEFYKLCDDCRAANSSRCAKRRGGKGSIDAAPRELPRLLAAAVVSRVRPARARRRKAAPPKVSKASIKRAAALVRKVDRAISRRKAAARRSRKLTKRSPASSRNKRPASSKGRKK